MDSSFFSANRQALLKKLQNGALVVITGYEEMQRMHDSANSFEQEANFLYLTGLAKPGWWLILDGTHGTQWLVSPEVTEMQAVFDGEADPEEIYSTTGIKTILSRDEALRRLRQLVKHHSIVYTTEQPSYLKDHAHFQLNTAQPDLKKVLERIFDKVQICNKELAVLRTKKQPVEIAAIQRAINVTVSAFKELLPKIQFLKNEYELEAVMTYEMRRRGSRHAYDPIVASSINACTLHYGANTDRLIKKSLVLFDVGARVDGYAADISRTYAYGTATKRQKAVHHAVVTAQNECIALLKPGLSFKEYDEKCENIMIQSINDLGLSTDKYREYFPHAMGHGLGINVHDVLVGYESFEPGMVLTVEPGIYIREEAIGVRIEDDILITDKGHRNLSAGLSTSLG